MAARKTKPGRSTLPGVPWQRQARRSNRARPLMHNPAWRAMWNVHMPERSSLALNSSSVHAARNGSGEITRTSEQRGGDTGCA